MTFDWQKNFYRVCLQLACHSLSCKKVIKQLCLTNNEGHCFVVH